MIMKLKQPLMIIENHMIIPLWTLNALAEMIPMLPPSSNRLTSDGTAVNFSFASVSASLSLTSTASASHFCFHALSSF